MGRWVFLGPHSSRNPAQKDLGRQMGLRFELFYQVPGYGSECVFVCMSKTLFLFRYAFFLTGVNGLSFFLVPSSNPKL